MRIDIYHFVNRFVLATLLLLAGPVYHAAAQADNEEIMVYKAKGCGCCNKWITHLEANGFRVKSEDLASLTTIKAMAGVKPELASCHTAMVGDYVIEGHVPADDIKRLLKERPAIAGLAVPGMPAGSPGMEGGRKDAYKVLGFDEKGNTKVFSTH